MKLRLHQFLSKTGLFKSKSEAIDAIFAGDITIDGAAVRKTDFQFNPNSKKVEWNGREITIAAEPLYFLLNKPAGYLSSKQTANDIKAGKKSMFDLIDIDDQAKNTLFSVGRLDEDSEGLIILTNDGDLSDKVTKPENGVVKKYAVMLEKNLLPSTVAKIEKGVELDTEEGSYKTKPCRIDMLSQDQAYISLTEGRKREVKQIFHAVGNTVLKLRRVSIGNLSLDVLKIPLGKYVKKDKEFILSNLK